MKEEGKLEFRATSEQTSKQELFKGVKEKEEE